MLLMWIRTLRSSRLVKKVGSRKSEVGSRAFGLKLNNSSGFD